MENFKLTLTCISLSTMLCYSTAELVLLNGGKNLEVMRDQVNVLGVGSMNRELDKYLKVTPIRTQKVSNAKVCQLHCIAEKNCSSINVAKPASSAGIVQCELLSINKYQISAKGKLTVNSDYEYNWWKNSFCDANPCKNGGSCIYEPSPENYTCACVVGTIGRLCESFSPEGWVLIARFSNADEVNWSQASGAWWYDSTSSVGDASSTSTDADMINSHFWETSGKEFKLTRSDDTSNTALLQTTTSCLAGQTFRAKMASFGNYRNGARWRAGTCQGSCDVVYGGSYLSTYGFEMAQCNGQLQAHNKAGFFCQWGGGDASVIMIGGGGNCSRADHGIMVTERDYGGFGSSMSSDFGHFPGSGFAPKTVGYALNLWIKL